MNKTLKQKRALLDYLSINLYFYYCFISPIIAVAKRIRQGKYQYEDMLIATRKITEACLKTGVNIELIGIENLTAIPRVIVANHMSSLETVIFPHIVKDIGEVSFVVKQELFDRKYFADIMRAMRCIPMTRSNPRQDIKAVFEQGEKLLNEGISVIIFPQKTRSTIFDNASFNSIGCKLALKNKVPLQSVALKTDFIGSSKFIKDYGKVDRSKTIYFKFGELIEVTKENQQQVHNQCIEFIQNNLRNFS